MEKALRIEAFRNIGFKNKKPNTERLVLSHSLKKNEIGDLIILIGANNSGKTNVLEALDIYSNSEISTRDVSDLFMEEECREPSLTLSYKNDKGDKEYSLKKTMDGKRQANYPKENEDSNCIEFEYLNQENILDELEVIANYEEDYLSSSEFRQIMESVNFEELTKPEFDKIVLKSFSLLDKLVNNYTHNYKYGVISFRRNDNDFIAYLQDNSTLYDEYINYKENDSDPLRILETNFRKEFNYDFNSKISYYKERIISNDHLSCSPDEIENNFFFSKLLNSINTKPEEILKAYEVFEEQKNNKGVLKQLEKKLNKKLAKISSDFNKLYYLENNKYSFNIDLESETIYFSIFRNEQSLFLDYQSTGFKWFFNLYFGLLNSIELNTGDIIIMDEPATHLHPKGQRELRQFLKEFAIRNDISIIIATHSPFLIDLDYLDELRIIENNDNITSITNNFAAVNTDDPDSLLPIKNSLTVENHVICNPDKKIIFVEGITDYNYLTAFKNKLKKEELVFIPINGLGKSKEENMQISKRLIEIRKNDPILLVDGDNAGKIMESINENSELEVISLEKIQNYSFKTIESLFSSEDMEKFGLKDKHASTSSLFKKKILFNEESVSEETENNFKALFERLCE
ncbi:MULTISPECIES: AAA family ATPase [Treponema]|jgi:hypothetical protein|uniref:Endonuclease GajA/Old nuclease/RecF-like AAA domain-containing protein n=1 Tax=Treponema denticola H1-T TaxID=999431 RepID=M2CB01_TREDN|nr:MULTISPECIES: AAA family ATPase [Treponema]EMB27216.1 hypothetical protein HMPREF9727_02431 [Treponema denticola MYR-T]EMB34537.1 hypothetical protein HMPREF9725_00076 [Treponema denticola H1-T]EMB45329.1 hypothetical protein HMPREF9729_01547 [Treponema denticola ASLM]EMB45879.1 hypothetical protein HMPREF9730_01005 [Treponema denticola AL-2]EMD57236.1 hypothetical protein HMPREF9728_00730 [Treponema denticola US-Trep]